MNSSLCARVVPRKENLPSLRELKILVGLAQFVGIDPVCGWAALLIFRDLFLLIKYILIVLYVQLIIYIVFRGC